MLSSVGDNNRQSRSELETRSNEFYIDLANYHLYGPEIILRNSRETKLFLTLIEVSE